MKTSMLLAATFGLLTTIPCFSAAPAGAPAGSTGLCKDGSYYSGAEKKGACRGHKGVKDWFGNVATAPAAKTDTMTKAVPAKAVATSETSTTAKIAGTPPAGATGRCKDGSYYSGAEKKGACRGHKGIQDWYGAAPAVAIAEAPATKTSTPIVATPSTATPMATSVKSSAPADAPNPSSPPVSKTIAPPAPGAPGMVWVNTDTKVYHCPNSRWYGKTKKGEYVTEDEATAKGVRPDHGKACK